jgi:hypothetical protein
MNVTFVSLTFGNGKYVCGVAAVKVPFWKESSNHKILIFVFVRRVANTNLLAALPNALRKVTCVEKFFSFSHQCFLIDIMFSAAMVIETRVVKKSDLFDLNHPVPL